jgi:hypothetical protein
MVHRRELDGQALVFGNQGDLWGNAMTWWDHDTGSVWSQPLGEAILGPRRGATLELVPSTLTRWSAWREAHPETVALDAPGGRSSFALGAMVIVVDFAGETVSYGVADLRTVGVVNDTVAGADIAVVIDPENGQRWAVFSRRLDDRTVTLEIRNGKLRDVETQTTWDPVRGVGRDGPLAGEVLDLLPGFTAFPRDYETFWPDGRRWRAP